VADIEAPVKAKHSRWKPDIGNRAAIEVMARNAVPILGVALLAWPAATAAASFLLDAALMTATSLLVLSEKWHGNRSPFWLRWPSYALLLVLLLMPHALAAWLLAVVFDYASLAKLASVSPGWGFWLGLLLQAVLQWHELRRNTSNVAGSDAAMQIASRIPQAWLRVILAGAAIAYVAVFQPWWPVPVFRLAIVVVLAVMFSACEIYPRSILRWLQAQAIKVRSQSQP
jgi:hypothetical protein